MPSSSSRLAITRDIDDGSTLRSLATAAKLSRRMTSAKMASAEMSMDRPDSGHLHACRSPREIQRRIGHWAEAQAQQIAHVVLIKPPRLLRTLSRELIDGALNIAGREIDQRLGFARPGAVRRAGRVAQ